MPAWRQGKYEQPNFLFFKRFPAMLLRSESA